MYNPAEKCILLTYVSNKGLLNNKTRKDTSFLFGFSNFTIYNLIVLFIIQATGSSSNDQIYELHPLPKDIRSSDPDVSEGRRAAGIDAVWVARNRFAVLDKTQSVRNNFK